MTTDDRASVHYRACNLCEAICGIEIRSSRQEQEAAGSSSRQRQVENRHSELETRNSKLEPKGLKLETRNLLDIRGDNDDPFSRGYICPKAAALGDLHFDTDRLRYPVRRTAQGWQRMAWDEAFDEVAANLKRINVTYGKNPIAAYLGNPTVHNYGALLFAPKFLRSLHTRNKFSATSVDQLAHHLSAYLMFGHQLLLPVPDVDRTKFFLMLGANPAVSNGSMMTAPGMGRRLQKIRERGGKVILIDPRFTETARLADRHLFIRPGTDVFLLLALLNVILGDGHPVATATPRGLPARGPRSAPGSDFVLNRMGPLAGFTKGSEIVGNVVAEFPPEKVASITGIESEQIRLLAREFASAESAVCYGRIGVSTQEFGGVCQWLINVLNIVTGNLDRPGGAMFTLPAFDPITAPEGLAPRGSYARWHSRVRKLPEFAGELPVVTLAEEILTDGPGQIKALVTSAGNPVLSTPNGRELDRALAGLEFMVSIDPYINETTRHAHIILPPTSALERGHYDIAFHLLAVRNTTRFSPAFFQREADSRHDWEIFSELQMRMEDTGLVGRVKSKVSKKFVGPERILDLGLRLGPYGAKFNPFSKGLTLRKVKKATHGIDLGPLRSCLPGRLRTSDKRIDLAPDVLVKDVERVKAKFLHGSYESNGHLLLIGRRQLRSNNSWMHNSERLLRGKAQCTILMHPKDAGERNLSGGQNVSVRSRVGSVVVPVEISEEMMPGVVSIPHGWGHDRQGIRLEVAQLHAGGSINDITDELAIDALCGTAAFNGTWVEVEAVI